MHPFFAYLARMKNILRWPLMRNTQQENIAEHSLQVAMLAHGLAVIAQKRLGKEVNPEHIVLLAVFHDAPEVITGDMPTPIKYFSPQMRQVYSQVEAMACQKLISMLPEDLQAVYAPLLAGDAPQGDGMYVKAADKLAAYLKCVEEVRSGNREFAKAEKKLLQQLQAMAMPEVDIFLQEFAPSFALSLDELND